MKPSHIAFGFAGIAIIIGGAFALKGKLNYDRDGREINRLIGEYKAMGVPTNGTEYFHKIPDSENAWIELVRVFFRDGKMDSRTALPQSSLGAQFNWCGNNRRSSYTHKIFGR